LLTCNSGKRHGALKTSPEARTRKPTGLTLYSLEWRRAWRRLRKFLRFAGDGWFGHANEQPSLGVFAKVNCDRQDILSEIGKGCFKDRCGVVSNAPANTLAPFVHLSGDWPLVGRDRIAVGSADHAGTVDRDLEKHGWIVFFLLGQRKDSQRQPFFGGSAGR
jgi:hypothetical protein